jgi:hypothetical protein
VHITVPGGKVQVRGQPSSKGQGIDDVSISLQDTDIARVVGCNMPWHAATICCLCVHKAVPYGTHPTVVSVVAAQYTEVRYLQHHRRAEVSGGACHCLWQAVVHNLQLGKQCACGQTTHSRHLDWLTTSHLHAQGKYMHYGFRRAVWQHTQQLLLLQGLTGKGWWRSAAPPP